MGVNECGTIGGKLGRGNRSTRRELVPVTLRSPQIPHVLTQVRTQATVMGSRRLTAWATAWPGMLLCSFFAVTSSDHSVAPSTEASSYPEQSSVVATNQCYTCLSMYSGTRRGKVRCLVSELELCQQFSSETFLMYCLLIDVMKTVGGKDLM
jgi:hypothetical protein